jgi:hypothetical protein
LQLLLTQTDKCSQAHDKPMWNQGRNLGAPNVPARDSIFFMQYFLTCEHCEELSYLWKYPGVYVAKNALIYTEMLRTIMF